MTDPLDFQGKTIERVWRTFYPDYAEPTKDGGVEELRLFFTDGSSARLLSCDCCGGMEIQDHAEFPA